ncbi:MAG: YaaA family protein [Leptospiraceae bacterium]|nr:YaaA family protein [Leptospiraceae bacterium]
MLLSPAKSLRADVDRQAGTCPAFRDKTTELVKALQKLDSKQIADLMRISPPLAAMNQQRFADWHWEAHTGLGQPAALLFDGPVYQGLDYGSLRARERQFANRRLRILSGLYGILRPGDLIQPYRLEMGSRFRVNSQSKDLYQFWGSDLQNAISNDLPGRSAVILNLASREYARAARLPELQGERAPELQVIEPHFLDRSRKGEYKMMTAYAKRARGLMARFVVSHRIQNPTDLQRFDLEGYRLDPAAGTPASPVFKRDHPIKA